MEVEDITPELFEEPGPPGRTALEVELLDGLNERYALAVEANREAAEVAMKAVH